MLRTLKLVLVAGIAAFVVSMVFAGGLIYGMVMAAFYFVDRVLLS